LLPGLLFDPEDGGDMFLRNVWLAFNELHGVISQNPASKEVHAKFEVGESLVYF
jgi:hypothetical protein